MLDFWQFVHERQLIYHRRHSLGMPFPWTGDLVLGKFFFTNVFRELDAGTRFLMSDVIEPDMRPQRRILATTIIRMMKLEDAWSEARAAAGPVKAKREWVKEFSNALRAVRGRASPSSTRRHTFRRTSAPTAAEGTGSTGWKIGRSGRCSRRCRI